MEQKTIREAYGALFSSLYANSIASSKINPSNVYQVANEKNRAIADKLVSDNLLPESHLSNTDNFLEFYRGVKNGKSGLILMEHYSNTDLPVFLYMLDHSGNEELVNLSKRVVAVAGKKLNEDNPIVKAFAEGFTRIVIYPTRSLSANEKNAGAAGETTRARNINLSAMRAVHECKKRGEVILVFPAGTRYREGSPETKRGLREIDSYIRLFDTMILVSINGELLKIQPGKEDMLSDLVTPDKIVITASPVINCREFRNSFLASLPASEEDPKQKIVDHMMEILESQHNSAEETRFLRGKTQG